MSNLPASYKPFEEIVLCSNTVTGGGVLALEKDIPPILIGQGQPPMVWIQARQALGPEKYLSIVDASVSRYPALRIEANGAALTIRLGDNVLLHVIDHGDGRATVDELDLRPFGLLLTGDKSELRAGGVVFRNSRFDRVASLIGLDG